MEQSSGVGMLPDFMGCPLPGYGIKVLKCSMSIHVGGYILFIV